ncbi:Nudix (Nucleoside diphosphate linked moiety X)-type motif 1 [Phytophthora pseudosyringae]|uniref:Nudix (Nucleoside diphosphate linked moiety X)-type motif 1 n=1 Tax=Phytophthora pseudosyringae TaxID=221518 RepID=A0A8T1V7G4_9STRA|nr:Nudix (Nucleoside diphosphate linked moiety X)-type motif 1 [Phytophthora pseudosyringae]
MLPVPPLPRKLLTLALIVRGGGASKQVLLGMKKRGFGVGKWNGFGGKVEAADASIAAAAAREVAEEANVGVEVEDLQPRGVLLFSFDQGTEVMEVHVFLTQQFSGQPSESEEMRPQWFDAAEIPFKGMWADDHIWLPHVLGGKSVRGHFRFAADEDTLLDHELEVSPAQAV